MLPREAQPTHRGVTSRPVDPSGRLGSNSLPVGCILRAGIFRCPPRPASPIRPRDSAAASGDETGEGERNVVEWCLQALSGCSGCPSMMSEFELPPLLIDPTTLPPPILTSEPGSFAEETLQVRIPHIVEETIALNRFPPELNRALENLRTEILSGAIRGLREDAADRPFWDHVGSPWIGHTWLNLPWYGAEAFFYRRVLEATRYFQPGPLGFDPFGQRNLKMSRPRPRRASSTTS